ncbi:hypothetical protein GH153_03020 [bacterium]|nr:hypothetical protein [bacterium]
MKVINVFQNPHGLTVSLVAYVLNIDEAYLLSVIAEQKELTNGQKKKLERFLKFLEN